VVNSPKSEPDFVQDKEDFPEGLPIASNGYAYRAQQQASKPSFAEVMQSSSSLTDAVD
jgi:hypothetical protein